MNGVLRVGVHIRHANVLQEVRHTVILPRKGHVAKLVIKHYHERTGHQGRRMPLNEIRSCEFWIVGGSSAVRSHISIFVSCQRYRGGVPVQKMANPHSDRPVPARPFTHCAIGCF